LELTMSEPLDQPIRPTATPSHVPWWSTSRSQRLIKVIASLLLELLPVEAVLVVAAGLNSQNGLVLPVPPWFLAGTLVLAFGIGRFLIGANAQRLLVISLPFMVLTALLLIRVSPAAYGSTGRGFFDWSWIFAFGQDFADQASRSSALIPLLLLLAYLWWRGLRLGGDTPDHQTVMNRFKYGMIAMIACTIAAIAVADEVQPRVIGILSLLLPAEVFVGLIASALGSLAQNQIEHRGDAYLANNNQLWLGTAFALAVGTVGFALLINLILNYQSVGSLLALLGPVGPVVSRIVTVLVNALAQLLRFLFDWLIGSFKPISGHQSLNTPHSPLPPPNKTHHHSTGIPQIFFIIAGILLQGLAIVLVIFLLLWMVRTVVTQRRPPEDILDEERESLDSASIFKEQFRAFLSGLRPQRKAAWVDPLTPGSVRYLYREVLETASRRGLAKNSDETPDEYGARLASSGALAGPERRGGETPEALEELSEAYDVTRYAERELTAHELSRVRQLAKMVTERLRHAVR
jgi:hypothetical protein